MSSKPTVYVVDDDPAIVASLLDMLEAIELRAEAFLSAEAFLEAYEPRGPGCLVLDVRMPGMSGLELQKRLAAAGIGLPVIIITGHGDIRMSVEAMKSGAFDFLEKPVRMQELCDCIQRAVCRDIATWQLRSKGESARQRLESLTRAEREVLDLLLAGNTNRRIAEKLGLSLRAVEERRARMKKRLGVRTQAEWIDLVRRSTGE